MIQMMGPRLLSIHLNSTNMEMFFLGLLIGTGMGMLLALMLSILIRDRDE